MDVPLDDVGVRQAQALGTVASLTGAARVVSSPLERARATAAALGLPVEVDDRWTEIDYGVFDGAELTAAADLWVGWDADLEYRPPGGESLADLGRRVRAACSDVWEEAADRDVVVVSHVSPIKAAVAWTLQVGDEIAWRTFVAVASITRVGVTERGPLLRSFNEVAHLGQVS